MQIIPSVVALIFTFLGLLHFYWAIFGISKPELVLPIKPLESKVKVPGPILTATVGLGLILFSLLFINQAFNFLKLPWLSYVQIGVAILFLIRAFGDLKYVGFSKSIKDTPFAQMDTKYYSPLCLIIAVLIGISVFVL